MKIHVYVFFRKIGQIQIINTDKLFHRCSVALAYTFFKNRLAELDDQIGDSEIALKFAKHTAHKI